jgi:hypothetical protein
LSNPAPPYLLGVEKAIAAVLFLTSSIREGKNTDYRKFSPIIPLGGGGRGNGEFMLVMVLCRTWYVQLTGNFVKAAPWTNH